MGWHTIRSKAKQLLRSAWRIIRIVVALGVLLIWYAAMAITIFSWRTDDVSADAIIVLGAAAWGNRPSPIFRERLNHALRLYQAGDADRIIVTGGVGLKSRFSEAEVGFNYLVVRGMSAENILIEDQSANTIENLANVKQIAATKGLDSFILVSTPFHMKRAMFIAQQVGLNAYSSPTRSTHWLNTGLRQYLFMREVAAVIQHWLLAPWLF